MNIHVLLNPCGFSFYAFRPHTGISYQASLKTLADTHSDFDVKKDRVVNIGASYHISPHIHLFQSINVLRDL